MTGIPQQRIVEKLDEYMGRRDYAGARRHLLYWLDEAVSLADRRGELVVRNELIGHFRKVGERDQALRHADAALALVAELGLERTVSAGTTYTNAATAFSAFGLNARALELFEMASELYEGAPDTPPHLLGGLLNNRALACVALGRFDEADALYARALDVMGDVEHGGLEQAITYLNRADAVVARTAAALGSDDVAALQDEACEAAVDSLLQMALDRIDDPDIPHDGYYAFVCEKCAPTFAHYGYFLVDADLRQRAEAIYGRD